MYRTISAEEYKKLYGEAGIQAFDQPQQQQSPGSSFAPLSGSKDAFNGLSTMYGGTDQGIARKLQQDVVSGAQDMQNGNPIQGAIKAGVRTAGDFAGAVYAPVSAISESLGVNKLFGAIQDNVQQGKGLVGQGVNKLTDIPAVQDFARKHPNAGEDFNRVMNIVLSTLDTGKIEPSTALPRTIDQLTDPITDVTNTVKNTSDSVLNSAKQLKDNIQLSIADKNVNPQLKASADRLFLDGASTRMVDPVKTYDTYLNQSKKALTDIHADPAISDVGNKIGDAFTNVVKQRQAVGRTLGDELKNVGKVKVSITEPKTTLLTNLKESGLSYNPKIKQLTSFQGSKFAPEEIKMLNDYTNGVLLLGDSPSVSQIDNFISKTRSQLAFTKGKSGVIGATNAERIINGSIKGLRESLNPAKNGNTALSKYWQANNTYSQLSDFIDEGSGYLGKTTQSGDFSKDASIAKSSVQSILNNGKKDWLIKLEGLTGYKALDNAVLALQAMKDAGDFRGLSLLQAISDGSVPTSKTGWTQKMIDHAMQVGSRVIAGTPEEQTRAFLQELQRSNTQTLQ